MKVMTRRMIARTAGKMSVRFRSVTKHAEGYVSHTKCGERLPDFGEGVRAAVAQYLGELRGDQSENMTRVSDPSRTL